MVIPEPSTGLLLLGGLLALARRRRASIRIPDSLHCWLFGQMLASFGILYYGLTEDLRWYVGGLVILVLSFLAFPIRRAE